MSCEMGGSAQTEAREQLLGGLDRRGADDPPEHVEIRAGQQGPALVGDARPRVGAGMGLRRGAVNAAYEDDRATRRALGPAHVVVDPSQSVASLKWIPA